MQVETNALPDFEGLPIDRHVGERLQVLRVSRNFEVSFIARALEVPVPLVAAWEQGLKRIAPHHLVALTELFFCPLAAFFEGMNGVCLDETEKVLGEQGFNCRSDG